MSQTIALKMVDASLATAMSYLSVVWGILSGYLVFGEVSGSDIKHKLCVSFMVPFCLENHDEYCVQVPNLLSLGGALLVCSCTLVLGLAEHLSGGEEPHWQQQVCASAQKFSTKLWDKCTGKHALYETVATEELD